MSRIRPSVLIIPLLLLVIGTASQALRAAELTIERPALPVPTLRMPGEFERQDAILLAWDESDEPAQETQIDIIRAIWRSVPVILLVSNADAQMEVAELMRVAGLPKHAVRIVRVAVDTVWARDFGPIAIRGTAGQSALINAEYERSERPNDDDVPLSVAPLLGMPAVDVPVRMDGGNLLSNGAGLILSSTRYFDDNADRNGDQLKLMQQLKTTYGAQQVLILEPLAGEGTGHVDMFATFTASNRVIVGRFSPDDDPVNAEILDRNADRLAHVMTPQGRMQVTRIPMPPVESDVWRTYTNVIYANGTLLMPIYPGNDRLGRQQAMAAYRQALPGWRIVSINCNGIIESGGALHCLSMNLGRVPRLPQTTPLDGRPDPMRLLPDAIDGDDVIVESPFDEQRPADGQGKPDRWEPVVSQLRSRAPTPQRERPANADNRVQWQPFRINAFSGKPGSTTRNESPAWKGYQTSPRRLRDYDHQHRLSILRRN